MTPTLQLLPNPKLYGQYSPPIHGMEMNRIHNSVIICYPVIINNSTVVTQYMGHSKSKEAYWTSSIGTDLKCYQSRHKSGSICPNDVMEGTMVNCKVLSCPKRGYTIRNNPTTSKCTLDSGKQTDMCEGWMWGGSGNAPPAVGLPAYMQVVGGGSNFGALAGGKVVGQAAHMPAGVTPLQHRVAAPAAVASTTTFRLQPPQPPQLPQSSYKPPQNTHRAYTYAENPYTSTSSPHAPVNVVRAT